MRREDRFQGYFLLEKVLAQKNGCLGSAERLTTGGSRLPTGGHANSLPICQENNQ